MSRTPQLSRRNRPNQQSWQSRRTWWSPRAWQTWLVLIAVVVLGGLGTLTWWHGSARFSPGTGPDFHLDPPQELDPSDLQAMTSGIPVLCYHYFRPSFAPGYLVRVLGAVILSLPTLGPKEFWTTPISEFERHLRYFRDHGIAVVTLDDLVAASQEGRPVPRPAVVLTIDDADQSVYELAYPLLKKYGLRAHLFVPTGKVGTQWSGLTVCSWSQLREMQTAGVMLLESHAHDLHWKIATPQGWEPVIWHPDQVPEAAVVDQLPATDRPHLARQSESVTRSAALEMTMAGTYRAVAADLLTSRNCLAARTGRPPAFLAWPYGFASDGLDSVAAAVGFSGTVSLHPTPWQVSESLWHIGRVGMTAKATPDLLKSFCSRADGDGLLARKEP